MHRNTQPRLITQNNSAIFKTRRRRPSGRRVEILDLHHVVIRKRRSNVRGKVADTADHRNRLLKPVCHTGQIDGSRETGTSSGSKLNDIDSIVIDQRHIVSDMVQ